MKVQVIQQEAFLFTWANINPSLMNQHDAP